MSDEEYSEPEALLAPLDAEPGPMPPLTAAEANVLTSRVVARWSNALSGVEPADADAGPAVPLTEPDALRLAQDIARRHARLRPWRAAGVAGIMLSVGGLAFGALHEWKPAIASPTRSGGASRAQALQPGLPSAGQARPDSMSDRADALGSQARSLPPTAAGTGLLVPEPEASLERANGLRARRNWRAAQRMYLHIAESGAHVRERYVASVAAAALSLQHTHEPRLALSLYLRALRALPEGDLSEDIRLGIAHAFNALDDSGAEANALREFLAHHPDSSDADAARERLQALSAVDAPYP
jgi:hypothetical protein